MDEIEDMTPSDVPEAVKETAMEVTEPTRETVKSGEEILLESINQLAKSIEANTESLRQQQSAISGLEKNFFDVFNRMVELTKNATETAVETTSDAIEAATVAPAAAAEAAEVVVEKAEEPIVKRRRRFGRRRR